MWMAEWFAGLGAFLGTVALMKGLLHAHAKILELRHSQLQQEKGKAFEKLIKRELYQIDTMLRYPELRDTLVRLEHEIAEAEKKFETYAENAEVCRDLLSTFRSACANTTRS